MPAREGRSETRQTLPGARPNRRAQPRSAGGRGALPSPRVGCMSRRATGGPRWMAVAAARAAVQNSAYRPPRWRPRAISERETGHSTVIAGGRRAAKGAARGVMASTVNNRGIRLGSGPPDRRRRDGRHVPSAVGPATIPRVGGHLGRRGPRPKAPEPTGRGEQGRRPSCATSAGRSTSSSTKRSTWRPGGPRSMPSTTTRPRPGSARSA